MAAGLTKKGKSGPKNSKKGPEKRRKAPNNMKKSLTTSGRRGRGQKKGGKSKQEMVSEHPKGREKQKKRYG